ncbi:hypothetical protein AX14_009087 [Amanita brunnescens Koide BX004]|nr:hypothetical protein AX14_009087 [Amanita brunnescens Koide BX004]
MALLLHLKACHSLLPHTNNSLPYQTNHWHNILPHLPLFSSIDTQGNVSYPIKSMFLNFCHKGTSSANLNPFSGHSFQIGGTVELLLSGVPPEVVASLGSWLSMAFLLYWCKLDEIIPNHILSAYNKQRLNVAIESLHTNPTTLSTIHPTN